MRPCTTAVAVALFLPLFVVGGCSPEEPAPPPAGSSPTSTAVPTAPSPPRAAAKPPERILTVLIDAEPDRGPAPLSVNFGIYDPHETLQSPVYRWNFGDGSPDSNERGPIHIFEKPGRYNVTLRVDEGGATDEDSYEIIVTQPGED